VRERVYLFCGDLLYFREWQGLHTDCLRGLILVFAFILVRLKRVDDSISCGTINVLWICRGQLFDRSLNLFFFHYKSLFVLILFVSALHLFVKLGLLDNLIRLHLNCKILGQLNTLLFHIADLLLDELVRIVLGLVKLKKCALPLE